MKNLNNKKFYIIVISFVVVIFLLAGLLIYKGINKDSSSGEEHSEEYLYYNQIFYLELIEKENDKYYIITRVKSDHENDNEIVVPDTIDNIPVRKLVSYASAGPNIVSDFGNFYSWRNILKIKIGKNIEYIGTEKNNEGILKGGTLGDNFLRYDSKTVSIEVDENNLVYASKNGVLFNKDFTILIKYPNNKVEDYSTFVYEIPETVNKIYNYAFYRNSKIKTLKLNQNLKEIGNYAFYQCTNLSFIYFNNCLESIGHLAFRECSLNSINLPDTLVSLGNSAFYKNATLQSAKIAGKIQNIGENIFDECSSDFSILTTESNLEYLKNIINFKNYTIQSE